MSQVMDNSSVGSSSMNSGSNVHYRKKHHHAAWILGIIACACAGVGTAAYGAFLFPMALTLSVIGFILGVVHKTRSVLGIIFSVLAWILLLAGAVYVSEDPTWSGLPQPGFIESAPVAPQIIDTTTQTSGSGS